MRVLRRKNVHLTATTQGKSMSASPSCLDARLADHVRACCVGDQVIFLDLLRGKYIGLGGPQIVALSATILGKASADEPRVQSLDTALLGRYIRRLRQQQLLSNGTASEPKRASPHFDTPTARLTIDLEDHPERFEWRQLLRLWRSTFIADRWLRRYSLYDIAKRIVELRARHPHRSDQASTDALRTTVGHYMRLRPFALSSHDRCLNDSLTLIHFLTTQGLFAQWIIGVDVHPFGAHSWAQADAVVLNDFAERVRHYQPILTV